MSSKLKTIPKPNYSLSKIPEILKGININKLYPVLREKGYLELRADGSNKVASKYHMSHFFLNSKATYIHKATGFDFTKPQIFATTKGLELLKKDYLNGDFIMKKNCVVQAFAETN